MAHWAVFDVDGTLLPGTSMEKMFLWELIRRGEIPWQNMAYFLSHGIYTLVRTRSWDVLKGSKLYLRGLSKQRVTHLAEWYFRRCIVGRLSRRGMMEVRHHRTRGFRILYLSGSPEFLIRCLQQQEPADYWLAAQPEVKQGMFTGALARPHPYGRQKKTYLLQLQHALDIDFSRSIVFANHHSDVHHMEMFGQAVAVNPTARLRQIARRRGWPIAIWD